MLDISIVIKGAGEMASGIAHRLFMANLTRICMIDIPNPLCVRRTVSFCEALAQGKTEVEGVIARSAYDGTMIAESWTYRQIAVIADPEWKIIGDIKPDVVIDAIMAKKNLGTARNEASLVIGVGPGFEAPHTVHAVIESNRGLDLGRAIYSGAPAPFTGVPALKAGYSCERTLRAPSAGNVRRVKSIGDSVKAGEAILFVNDAPITAEIDGIVRGMIAEIHVAEGEKLGDIEPGSDPSCCWKISDKARAIGGGVLEAVMHFLNK